MIIDQGNNHKGWKDKFGWNKKEINKGRERKEWEQRRGGEGAGADIAPDKDQINPPHPFEISRAFQQPATQQRIQRKPAICIIPFLSLSQSINSRTVAIPDRLSPVFPTL